MDRLLMYVSCWWLGRLLPCLSSRPPNKVKEDWLLRLHGGRGGERNRGQLSCCLGVGLNLWLVMFMSDISLSRAPLFEEEGQGRQGGRCCHKSLFSEPSPKPVCNSTMTPSTATTTPIITEPLSPSSASSSGTPSPNHDSATAPRTKATSCAPCRRSHLKCDRVSTSSRY